MSEEGEEVRLSLRTSFLDELRKWMGIQHMMGNLYPEGDPTQRLALLVLIETGRISKPSPKKKE